MKKNQNQILRFADYRGSSIECNFAHLRKVEVCFTYFATESEIELIRNNTIPHLSLTYDVESVSHILQ